jgi:hypothetical protein
MQPDQGGKYDLGWEECKVIGEVTAGVNKRLLLASASESAILDVVQVYGNGDTMFSSSKGSHSPLRQNYHTLLSGLRSNAL